MRTARKGHPRAGGSPLRPKSAPAWAGLLTKIKVRDWDHMSTRTNLQARRSELQAAELLVCSLILEPKSDVPYRAKPLGPLEAWRFEPNPTSSLLTLADLVVNLRFSLPTGEVFVPVCWS
jgi:hypothetical protein